MIVDEFSQTQRARPCYRHRGYYFVLAVPSLCRCRTANAPDAVTETMRRSTADITLMRDSSAKEQTSSTPSLAIRVKYLTLKKHTLSPLPFYPQGAPRGSERSKMAVASIVGHISHMMLKEPLRSEAIDSHSSHGWTIPLNTRKTLDQVRNHPSATPRQ